MDVFEAVLEQLPDGFVVHAPSLEIIRYNQAALRILGISGDQLMGKTPMDPRWKMVKEDGSPYPAGENPAVLTITHNRPVAATMGIECDDQPIRWIRIRTTPLAGRDGIHALVIFTDITDERLVNLQNELVLEASGIGIWRYNLQTHDLQWDSSMYQLYGVNVDDFTGDYDAWQRPCIRMISSVARMKLRQQSTVQNALIPLFRILIDGAVKYIQAKATISTDANGQPHIMIGTNWDITESKNREEELNALGEVKDRFIATMSHEVRTPLNGIIGMSEVIGRSVDDPQVREHVASLTQCAHHLNGLITEILDFSKLKSWKNIILTRCVARSDHSQRCCSCAIYPLARWCVGASGCGWQ